MIQQQAVNEAMLRIMKRLSEQTKNAAESMAATCHERTRTRLRPSVDFFRAFLRFAFRAHNKK